MPKDIKNKKNQAKKTESQSIQNKNGKPAKRYLTDQEKAWIIKERLARRPVVVWRYSNGKWNNRLILMLALMAAALIAGLFFLSR
jgi:hypothetical protein